MLSFNSEIFAGMTLLMMGITFLFAGEVNSTWGAIIPADFVIIALGAVTLGLGIWTSSYNAKNSVHSQQHHHH